MRLLAAGQNGDATAAFRRAIELRFDYPEAHNNLGISLKAAGLMDEAIAEYRQAIALRPAYARAYNNLGVAQLEKAQPEEALSAFAQAVALQPGFAEAQQKLARAYFDCGTMHVGRLELDEAVGCFRRAVEVDAASAASWHALGAALNCLGQFDEAAGCFRQALAINPEPRFYRSLVTTGRNSATAAEIAELRRRLESPSLTTDERVTVGFVLGKLLDEAGRYDEAFEFISRANRVFRESRAARGIYFDANALHHTVDMQIAAFTPEFFDMRRAWGQRTARPVFIVGMPRSGTSLVEQIAASHPAVFGAGEMPVLQRLPIRRVAPEMWNAEEVRASAKIYDDALGARAGRGAMRITDKMLNNLFLLGIAGTLFPDARVIFCSRDARDNCVSCFFQHFDGDNILFSYELADCARQLLESRRITAHWKKSLRLPMLEVQYESLVENQESESRRIIEFLGLPWHRDCLNFHRATRPVMTMSVWQVRQPMYDGAIGRWRHYQRQLAALDEILGDG